MRGVSAPVFCSVNGAGDGDPQVWSYQGSGLLKGATSTPTPTPPPHPQKEDAPRQDQALVQGHQVVLLAPPTAHQIIRKAAVECGGSCPPPPSPLYSGCEASAARRGPQKGTGFLKAGRAARIPPRPSHSPGAALLLLLTSRGDGELAASQGQSSPCKHCPDFWELPTL